LNQDKKYYDKEYVNKPIIFLKDVGKYCEVCHRHIFPRQKNQTCCSNKCRWKKRDQNRRRTGKDIVGIHAFVSLKKYGTKRPYRVVKLYLKKGIIEQVTITPKSKELWQLLEKIAEFRDIKKPLMELTA